MEWSETKSGFGWCKRCLSYCNKENLVEQIVSDYSTKGNEKKFPFDTASSDVHLITLFLFYPFRLKIPNKQFTLSLRRLTSNLTITGEATTLNLIRVVKWKSLVGRSSSFHRRVLNMAFTIGAVGVRWQYHKSFHSKHLKLDRLGFIWESASICRRN